jgi:hypothetical protein
LAKLLKLCEFEGSIMLFKKVLSNCTKKKEERNIEIRLQPRKMAAGYYSLFIKVTTPISNPFIYIFLIFPGARSSRKRKHRIYELSTG